ncbi:Nitrite reductase (NAD(P)H) small subunit [Methylophaga frappieri]|uniref:Nitrite reductase (NAD(P)H) small subunit n=1 Tax=Methylophaga frappieri (strain ATCC BAA-2434 / DSM 25690 / JAM7) TaxID=754477 RepID=I1YH30_METFJ|nr:nitrite reductase small subunit NirD [Methylophaga frappieri]AFJ02223.1 Nitrite reductase (NAD(P)H) small subunit [Methylophaga frappieri]
MDTQWLEVGLLADIPQKGSRVIRANSGDVAVFRTSNDEVFALFDTCPHKKGPLSQGIVFGKRVACPLHNWVIDLENGEATGPDEGCTHHFDTKIENGVVFVAL